MSSRLFAKGRRKDSLELIEWVLSDYHQTRVSISDIAQISKVSPGTVSKILDGKYILILRRRTESTCCGVRFYWDDEDNSIKCSIGGITRTIKWVRRFWKVSK